MANTGPCSETKVEVYDWIISQHPARDYTLNILCEIESVANLPFIALSKANYIDGIQLRIKKFRKEGPIKDLIGLREIRIGGDKFPEYNGNVNSLLNIVKWRIYPSHLSNAYFLNGDFKTGVVISGKYTENAAEYKDNLKNHLSGMFAEPPDSPDFSEYFSNFFTNSNLPDDYKKAFQGIF